MLPLWPISASGEMLPPPVPSAGPLGRDTLKLSGAAVPAPSCVVRLQEICTGADNGQAGEGGNALTCASLEKHHGPAWLGQSPSSAQCLFSRESFTWAARQADAVGKPLKKLLALEWGCLFKSKQA